MCRICRPGKCRNENAGLNNAGLECAGLEYVGPNVTMGKCSTEKFGYLLFGGSFLQLTKAEDNFVYIRGFVR